MVGSTNSLLLQQRDRYSDILINLDDLTVNITSPSLRSALSLSAADRRWIDFLTKTVTDTWDPANPSRPSTLGFAGSEEFIRLQFEEYLLALLSSVSFSLHKSPRPLSSITNDGRSTSADQSADSDPIIDFNPEFISAWKLTSNFALFSHLTSESALFGVIEPKHPTAGGLSVEDVQRRLAQQVAELHLDERMREGRETLNKSLMIGRERVGQGINKLWSDIEAMREAQRAKSAAEKDPAVSSRPADSDPSLNNREENGPSNVAPNTQGSGAYAWTNSLKDRASKVQKPDLSQMQASAKDGAAKAGAYLSSWGSWARERGKEWQEKRNYDARNSAP
jgi:Transport protein Avl9